MQVLYNINRQGLKEIGSHDIFALLYMNHYVLDISKEIEDKGMKNILR